MSSQVEFNASIYLSEQLNRQLVNTCQELAFQCVELLASKYNFDAKEAFSLLNLTNLKTTKLITSKNYQIF
jgi:hypothetical protein